MSDIAAWLRGISLEKYAPAFEANEIDLDALQHLTEADLVELGLPLGPRRKILAALQRPASSPAAASAGHEAAERRHITALFSDIVGSTELSGRLDPEAMSQVLRAYQDAVSAELRKYGGHLAKFMGDGVLAYFGWPQASEDAAERALRAGLGIVEAVARIESPDGQPLRTRVGIASGLVVIGGLVGSGSAQEEAIAGDVLNLAARLQALAAPNCVLIGEGTHQRVGGLFECEALGEHSLKGFPRPLPVWCVLREKLNANRFSSVRGQHAGFFGRKTELEFLGARWEEAAAGNGYAAIVLGEAGIGKSRLVSMLRTRVGRAGEISWQCSPYHSNNALYPVLQYLEATAAIAADDAPDAKAAKLEALLAQSGMDRDRAMPLFAELLSIHLEGRYQPAQGTPAQRKAALIAVLAEWVARTAEAAPLLLVLEDAHWIDATTLELMTRLVLTGGTMPALVIVTGRPSFASPWGGRPRVGLIALDRLARDDCARMVQSVIAARSLQNDLIAEIVAKSDGNPLFLEELTEAVLVSNLTGRTAIPDTLQDSLMARLDAMGKAKEVAQVASVIGRTFSQPLLAQIVEADAGLLEWAISQLVAAELIYPVGRVSDATYEFKHALVRDAAYESLLHARRRVLHERIAHALQTAFSQIAESEPELLAYHFGQAGQPEPASRYAERAGDRAAGQSAFAEAIANYRGAIRENGNLAAGLDRDRRELSLLLKLGPPLAHILGPQHAEVGEAYDRAVAIARALDDLGSLFQGIWGQWFYANSSRDLETARQRAEELVAISERSQDDAHLMEALHCSWATAGFRGDNASAMALTSRGVACYDPGRHHALGSVFGGHDPGVCAYTVNGAVLCLCGYPDQGRRREVEALALAERLGHPPSLALALGNGVYIYSSVRDLPAVESRALRVIQISEKYNFPPLLTVGRFFHAWSLADSHKGLAMMEAEYPRVNLLGQMPTMYASIMAERLAAAGRHAEALRLLDDVLGKSKTPGIGLFLSEIHRMRGECLAVIDPGLAFAAIQLAVEIARRQAARLLELRAAMSLVRLSPPGDTGRAAAALRDLLAGFTEGFGCADLVNARGMLESAGRSGA